MVGAFKARRRSQSRIPSTPFQKPMRTTSALPKKSQPQTKRKEKQRTQKTRKRVFLATTASTKMMMKIAPIAVENSKLEESASNRRLPHACSGAKT